MKKHAICTFVSLEDFAIFVKLLHRILRLQALQKATHDIQREGAETAGTS
jgi:hypothetical protein